MATLQRFVIIVFGSGHKHRFQVPGLLDTLRQPNTLTPSFTSCLVDVDELGVDDIVLGFCLSAPGAVAAPAPAAASGAPPAPGCAEALYIASASLWLACGQLVGRGVQLLGIALGHRLLGLFDRGFDVLALRRRRSCRDAPSASFRRCRPWRRRGCALRSGRAACGRRRRAIRRPWPSSPLRPWTSPEDEVMVIFCSLLVARSFAVTFRMPLASMSNVTSTCGTPRGAGGMPTSWNTPSSRLSCAMARSPWKTLISTDVWLSAAVENTSLLRVGNGGVALDQLGEHAAQRLDAERQRGHVEQQHVLHFAAQHAALHRRADRDHFVRIHALVRLLAEQLAHELSGCAAYGSNRPPARLRRSAAASRWRPSWPACRARRSAGECLPPSARSARASAS